MINSIDTEKAFEKKSVSIRDKKSWKTKNIRKLLQSDKPYIKPMA